MQRLNPFLKIHIPSIGIGAGAVTAIFVIFLVLEYGSGTLGTSVVQGITLDKSTAQNGASVQQTPMTLLVDNSSPILGSKDAPITMIEFGDYQCFYCNKFYHEIEPDIVKNYITTGKVRMVFKDFTIIGQDSVNAAHATHCAQENGKFWEFHDILYNNWTGENTGWASSTNLIEFAKKIGLDEKQFTKCMAQSQYISVVQGSLSNAKDLGLTGTPDFFIIAPDRSVTKIVGAQPFEVFDNIFKSKLKT